MTALAGRLTPAARTGERALRADILATEAEIAALRPRWAALAEDSRPATLFHHPAVWQSWAETMGQGGRNPVLALHDGPHLAGVLPLMLRHAWRGPTLGIRYDYDPQDRRWLSTPPPRMVPVRQVSPTLSLPATMLGPMLLARPDRREAVIRAAARGLAGLPGWDVLVLPVEEEEQALWRSALAATGLAVILQPLDRPACHLAVVAPMAEVVARQRKKFRQNVRRLEAAAARDGVTVSLSLDAGRSLPILRRLAADSWKARGRDGENALVPYEGPQAAFFEKLFLRPDAPSTVTAFASCEGRPVAVMTAVAQAGTLTTLLTFWNGEFKDASPGFLVLAALTDWAAANGIRLIDYNSNNPWLRHVSDRVTIQHNLLAFAPTPRGGALRAMRSGALRLRDMRRPRPAADPIPETPE